jgi:hypothetical protein
MEPEFRMIATKGTKDTEKNYSKSKIQKKRNHGLHRFIVRKNSRSTIACPRKRGHGTQREFLTCSDPTFGGEFWRHWAEGGGATRIRYFPRYSAGGGGATSYFS